MSTEKPLTSDIRSYKQSVAETFGRASHSYDAVAGLQRMTGQHLLQTLSQHSSDISDDQAVTLDLGTGTGAFLPALAEITDRGLLLACDLAFGMLDYARSQQLTRTGGVQYLNADAEQIPLADNSVSRIFSNLVLQWTRLELVLAEAHRVLRPGGCLGFTTLLDGTLHELRQSWLAIDNTPHVNRFDARTRLELQLADSPLNTVQQQVITHQPAYDSCYQLLRELKGIGAGFVPGRKTGLTTRRQLQRLDREYRSRYQSADGTLPASWQVAYVILQKPHGAERDSKTEQAKSRVAGR